jgi:integrase
MRSANRIVGGDAGLHCGEITALEWGDVDLEKRQLCFQRSQWKGHVAMPTSGRLRYVPMTERLAAALRADRHLRSRRIPCQSDGDRVTPKSVADLSAAWLAGLRCSRKAFTSCGIPLFTLGDAGRSGASDSGARRPSGSRHDAAVHALESRGARRRDSVAGSDGYRRKLLETSWRRTLRPEQK